MTVSIDIVLNSKDKDTDAARFAIRASLQASRLSPGNLAVGLDSLMNEYKCLSLRGKPIFLFPDKSVAAWESADSSWTIFGSADEMME